MQQLPFETITQFTALGITLVAGWLLGLASHSGGRKWRARLEEEELANARYRDLAEHDLREAHRKIRALEEENAQLAKGAPAHAQMPAPAPVDAADHAPAADERPHDHDDPHHGR